MLPSGEGVTGVSMDVIEDTPADRRVSRWRWLMIGVAVAMLVGLWLVTAGPPRRNAARTEASWP
jgi:hypothetical protein